MASVSAQLGSIVTNTRKLIDRCDALYAENDLLKLEIQSLKVALETSVGQVKALEERSKALAIARTLDDSEVDKSAINEKILGTKQKINDFVREIDKCIELLK